MKRLTLFLKIYLVFWLTIVLLAGVFIYFERIISTEPMVRSWQKTFDKIISFHAEQVISSFERDGSKAVADYLTRLEKATGMKANLFNDKAQDVAGQTVQKAMHELVLRALKENTPVYRRSDRLEIAAQKVTSPRGQVYVFVTTHLPKPPAMRPPPGPRAMGPPPGPPPSRTVFSPGLLPPQWQHNFLIRLIIGLVLSAVICYLLARYFTGPILKLSHAAKQLSEGNLSIRVKPTLGYRRDELTSLANDFDVMAERIETLITSQRNLLRDVSHELRSPLARLNVALELCRQNSTDDAQKHLDRMAIETQRLNDLIGEILTYNKMNAQTSEIQIDDINLADLIESIVSDANYEMGETRVNIKENVSVFLKGNEDLLRRGIENIVRNALYHTPELSDVEVSSSIIGKGDESRVLIRVRDHGPGVPEEMLLLIFKPFFKLSVDAKHHTGAGLGLAISNAAIRLHQGTLSAQNADNGGLIIEIQLPLRPQADHPSKT